MAIIDDRNYLGVCDEELMCEDVKFHILVKILGKGNFYYSGFVKSSTITFLGNLNLIRKYL